LAVLVLDKRKRPLMPCSEKRARLLLERGRAVAVRRYPFTIRLKDRVGGATQDVRIKLDPGSKTTGIALVADADGNKPAKVLALFELQHRGKQISKRLTARRAFRRRRRSHLRYRAPRFANRTRPQGSVTPSLLHRVDTTLSWVRRLRGLVPITGIATELVRFDTQGLERPGIGGVAYQQGTLAGYEVREYLLEKFDRACAYCGMTDVPLNIDHIHPRSRGGSSRISNLVLACVPCNTQKGSQPVEVFLADRPTVLARIKAQAKAPLQDAAAVNATRWALYGALKGIGLPVEASSGGRTKYNRCRLGIPKRHALDAACVGKVETLTGWRRPILDIRATGRGSYCRTRLDAYGFPRGYCVRQKAVRGFQTGDIVRADIVQGKKAGTYIGRVAVRASGSFNVQTPTGVVQGINVRHCTLVHRSDGYSYRGPRLLPTDKSGGIRRGKIR
jgi:5-methylcytosine-specific restriction endonuclease McrA